MMKASESGYADSSVISATYEVSGAIAAGGGGSELALRSDGTVWEWSNESGNGASAPTQVTASGWDGVTNWPVAVATGGNISLAVDTAGAVWQWTNGGTTATQMAGLSNILAIAAGGAHSLALDESGHVWAWGNNAYGQLGDNHSGMRYSSSTPVEVDVNNGGIITPLSGVLAIAAGESYSLALDNQGHVWAWGANESGELGSNSTTQSTVAVEVRVNATANLSNVTTIAAGGYHGLAEDNTGHVWAWGNNAYGQLGNNSTTNSLVAVEVSGLSGMKSIAAGGYHSLAIDNTGNLWAWGYNYDGQLGDGTYISHHVPEQVTSDGQALQVAADSGSSCELKNDGTVWVWGWVEDRAYSPQQIAIKLIIDPNDTNQDGIADSWEMANFGTIDIDPYEINGYSSSGAPLTIIQEYQQGLAPNNDANDQLTLAGASSRTIESYGTDSVTVHLTNGTSPLAHRPVIFTSTGAIGVTQEAAFEEVQELDNGNVPPSIMAETNSNGDVTIYYQNVYYLSSADTITATAGPSSVSVTETPQPITLAFSPPAGTYSVRQNVSIIDGLGSSAVIYTLDGTEPNGIQYPFNGIWSGDAPIMQSATLNAVDDAGYELDFDYLSPDATASATYVITGAIAAGGAGELALRSDGTVWEWGNGNSIPAQVTASGWDGTGNWVTTVATGSNGTSIALDATGAVWQWNNNGAATAAPVTGLSNIVTVAEGGTHSMALDSVGHVWAWGGNGSGQLGNNSASDSANPVEVQVSNGGTTSPLSGIVAVSAGEYYSMALDNQGHVWAWGADESGELGNNSTTQSNVAVEVQISSTAYLSNITTIAAGGYHGLAEDNTGQVWAWGNNICGQLGNNSNVNSSVAVAVGGLTGVQSLAGGDFHSLAVDNSGNVWAWGYNSTSGALGDTTWNDRMVPERVSSGGGVLQVTAGSYFSSELRSDGTVWTWGEGAEGQLGDGAYDEVNQPEQVAIKLIIDPNDTNQDGIPDYWEQESFGTIDIDPYTLAGYSISGVPITIIGEYGQSIASTPFAITSPLFASAAPGNTFNYAITATDSPSSFSATGLPDGLSIDPVAGLISGTVSTPGTYLIDLYANNSTATASAVLNLWVTSSPIISSSLTVSGVSGQSFLYSIEASNSPTTYGANGLPDGLTVDPSSGLISGTPTEAGTYSVLLIAGNTNGTTTADLTMTIAQAVPVITSATTVSPTPGATFSYAITATNNPVAFSASSLPPGLTFDSGSGVISGVLTSAGAYSITIGATNSIGTGWAILNLTGPPVISNPGIAYATVGQPFNFSIQGSGNPTSYNAANLPAGLSVDMSTGAISGTPMEVGTSSVTLEASNSLGQGSAPLMIAVQAASGSTPATLVLQAYTSPTTSYQTTSANITSGASSGLINSTHGSLIVGASATGANRALVGFDLTPIPPGATITSATLTMQGKSSSAFSVELHRADSTFSPNTTSWARNSTYNSTVLSSLNVSYQGSQTWTSSPDFVSAVQGALTAGVLDLMVVSPEAESPRTTEYAIFSSENASTPESNPALTITYTTSAPPVITGETDPVPVTTGAPFSYTVSTLNGATSFSASGLPIGLSIDPSTGIISGTTTLSGTFTVTLSASNGNGTATSTLTLTVGAAPTITSATTENANTDTVFSYSITATNTTGTSPVYSAENLPAGLTLDPGTGIISGLPNGGYNTAVIVGVTTIYGTATSSLAIDFPPIIYGPLVATGNVDLPFSYSIPTSNAPTTFTASGSGLPAGLAIDAYGNITGTPTSTTSPQGTQLTVTATNSAGSVSSPITVTVLPLPALIIPLQSLSAVVNVPLAGPSGDGNPYQVQAYITTAYNTPESLSVGNFAASGLPGGLTIDPTSGVISGTPDGTGTPTSTTASGANIYAVTVTASDTTGLLSGSGVINFTIYPPGPGISSPLIASAGVGQSFNYELTTIQGDSTSTTAVLQTPYEGLNLPPGLTYTDYGDYGEITGTPTTPGTYNITLSATDAEGISTANLVVNVASITGSSTATAQVGVPFTYTITDNNNPTNFQAANLPPGLSINSSTGVISGTPLAADTPLIQLTVTDSTGTETNSLLLSIAPASTDSQISFQQGVSPNPGYSVPSSTIFNDSQNPAAANQTSGSGTVLEVGQTTATASSRALLDFDLSALPSNAIITSAELVMTTATGNSSGTPIPIEVHQTTSSFNASTADWANFSTYNALVLSSLTIDPSASAATNTFPITTAFTRAVQQAYNSHNGLYLSLLAPSVEGGSTPDYMGFVTNGTNPAQNPQLIVTYILSAPVKPVITSATTATGTVNVAFTYTITASNNPQQFSATGLPAGLSLNTTTGTISGTVTTVGSTVATVNAINSAGTGSQAVTFNIDSATPATSLQVMSGNNQVGSPSTFVAQPLVVQANCNGTARPNALVTFTVPPGEGDFALTNTGNPTANKLTVVTNGSGLATIYFFLPQALQTTTVIASAGTAQPVSMVETSSLNTSNSSPLVILSVISGEGQSGPAGQTLPQPFVVQATNALGQPIVSQSLNLTVLDGGGQISVGGTSGSPLTTATDGSGEATIYLQPGGSAGTTNRVSCVAATGACQAVYLTAMTSSTTSSAPTPGGGTPPAVDTDPPPWNGQAWIVEADEDNGRTPVDPADPDPTQINIHWSPTVGPGITGFLVEKKIDEGQWTQLAEVGAGGQGYVLDTGLLANQEVLYRVTPYYGSALGSPCSPVPYYMPFFRCIQTQYKAGEALYLQIDWDFESDWDFEGGFSPIAASAPGENFYNGVNFNSDPVDYYDENASQMMRDVDSNPLSYGPWLDGSLDNDFAPWSYLNAINPAAYGYDYGISGFSNSYLSECYNAYDASTFGDGDVGFCYYVQACQYRFIAYPIKDYTLNWIEVLNPPATGPGSGDPTTIVGTHSWNINSSSETTSPTYELNPPDYSPQYGSTSLYVASTVLAWDGIGGLSEEEMASTGAPVVAATGTEQTTDALNPNASGVFGFGYEFLEIPGSTHTISWVGDSNLEVWGYNILTNSWEQVSNGENIPEPPYSTGGFGDWFQVVGTPGVQNNDSILLTVTTLAPDGTPYGTSTCKFYYQAPPSDLSIPIDEGSGSRYRKIALNGLPMAEEKPQQSGETDQEKEETYIDALTLGLRHSTTDAYLPVSGSDFSVSARRDFRSQVWEDHNGLRPHEEPDLPFGICWSSNLAPNIKLTHNNDPSSTTPDQATVTDETGAVHSFYRWYDENGNAQFFPMPSAKNEAQVPNLETLTVNTTTPPTYVFTRKYGATLTYQTTTLTQTISNDRAIGSLYSTTYQYARLVQAVDRVGNTVTYQFQGTTNLIPETITVANQPGIKLSIEQQPLSALLAGSNSSQSVITAIWDANGNKTSYTYASAAGDADAAQLTSVTTADGATTQYSYDATTEPDLTPHAANASVATYSYVDLKSITDPLGKAYRFTYAKDHSKFNFMSNPQLYTGYYVQSGCPRNVASVIMPDNTSANQDVATFVNNSQVKVQSAPPGQTGLVVSPTSVRQSQITDATGFTRTYTFGDPSVVSLPSFPQLAGNVTESKLIAYQSLSIGYGNLGSETFQFDINAAMALKQITDFSGNVTTFAHTDAWNAPSTYSQIVSGAALNGFYDDPTSQTDALNHSKSFTYFGANRIMQSSTDENGNKTYYDIDGLGRRTTEKLYDPNNHVVQETNFVYDNFTYPGFMTQKTVEALGGSDPSWTKPLVTQYVPDANGRVAQEIVDPSGLKLVTQYTYDANGNKVTSTDPKGNTTWFSYDTRNRLVTVTNPDGSQKQMVYDARGNKTIDYDENGIATLYQYDALNRLITQARDMNGNGQIDPGIDLITSYTYDNLNDKVTTTAPTGGITRMSYDNLQRVTDIYTSPDNSAQYHTQFAYGANSGGNVFDSSSFKPTHTVDPRGFATDVSYDALYRPVTKTVTYSTSGSTSSTSIQYDAVGNVTLVIDPLTHHTGTTYDALNRPLVTTYADNSTSQEFYTSTGFKWKAIDQNGNATQMQYDTAGRQTEVIGAVVNDGHGNQVSPVTETFYDAAGNVVETINPLQNKWDYVYDACNRKVQEVEPTVLDAVGSTTVRPTLAWQYDPAGRVVATTDARGNETDTTYDAANRVTDVLQPSVPISGGGTARPQTHTDYDADGNPLYVYNANDAAAAGGTFGGAGPCTVNTYDYLNRLLTTTDEAGITVTNSYDQVGNKLTVQDGNLNTTTFTYDGLNRNTSITDAASEVTTLVYDGLNKTHRIDALNQTTNYLYDVRNRLQHVSYNSTAAANSPRNYAYDYVGNLLTVTEPSKTAANVSYTYDALNRAISETSGGLTHSYTLDLGGNRLQTVYGGTGRTITSTYDALNRLSSMVEQTPAEITASSPGRTATYAYDLNGNIVEKTAPNGDTETYSYDALNRASIESAQTSGASSLFDYQYGYDLIGNVVTVNESYSSTSAMGNRLVTNNYDSINRLLVEAVTNSSANATTTYTYDSANNRLTKTITGTGATSVNYSYNNLNQLTGYSDGTRAVALSYDLDGNRATRVVTGGSDNGTDTYSYDFENRLIGLVKGTGGGGAGTYAYTYDYRTRRIVRDESSAGGAVTQLVFSGGTSVQEYDNAATTPTVEYIRGSDYGGGVGGILYTIRSGVPSYTHANERGDIVAKTDGTGALTYQAQYEGFGKQVATSGSTLDRQKSNSKDTDPTGLVDEGHRYRDLETGSFITRDPMGMVDGPNEYTYVAQNPWTKFDPEGLTAWDRVEGYAQGVTNGAIDLINGASSLINAIPRDEDAPGASAQIPMIPQVNNIGNATDKNDFISGQNGGLVFFAGGSAFVGGAEAKGTEAVVEGGEDALKAAGTKVAESPKPEPSPAPGAKPADETAPAAPSNAPPSGGCFIAGTLVSTPQGDVPIEKIKAGDLVWSLDLKSGHVVEKKVESIFHHVTDYWVDVTAGGETITATRGHRFWVESSKKWVEAMDLKPGMKLLGSSGRIVAITQVKVRHLASDRATYNFVVTDTHVYFVGRNCYVVHNGDQVPDDKIKAPPPKRGSAPIGEDGHPIELHHTDQTADSDLDEMTRTDHRGGDNFKKNHANTGQEPSKIDRKEFNKQKKEYWKKQSDSGRFNKC